ncbi:MAG: hypothetical protein ACREQ4_10530 [Candidatus Binataceae bacterium]
MPVNEHLKQEVEIIEQLRNYLAANPTKKTWVAATPQVQPQPGFATPSFTIPSSDPLLTTMDRLLATLRQVCAKKESKANLKELADLLKSADQDADRLANTFGMSKVALADVPKRSFMDSGDTFSYVRDRIGLAFQWYERLAFYLTQKGKDYLRNVVEVRSKGDGDDLKIHLFEHQFHENINPLSFNRVPRQNWSWEGYLEWVSELATENKDPLDNIVDYLLQKSPFNHQLDPTTSHKSRLSPNKDLRNYILVRVSDHIAGDDEYGTPGGPPRMWTFQVKVAATKISAVIWTPYIQAKHAIGLPALRTVNSEATVTRGVSTDFRMGTIYAMDGPSRMYCFSPNKFHSALMSGDPVTAAGILVVKAGRVLAVDNRSGHYQPGYMQLKFAVQYLRTNKLLEPDAFVSLYLDEDAAMYFSFEDFLEVAQADLPYPSVASKLSVRAKKYQGLPVARNYYDDLLPPELKRFPTDPKTGLNGWDQMLLKLYAAPGASLKSVVDDLAALLKAQSQPQWKPAVANPVPQPPQFKSAVPGGVAQQNQWKPVAPNLTSPGGNPSLAQSAYSAAVKDVEQKLAAGGAYCDLISLVDRLVTARQSLPTPGTDVIASYQKIKTRLQSLRPKETIMTG